MTALATERLAEVRSMTEEHQEQGEPYRGGPVKYDSGAYATYGLDWADDMAHSEAAPLPVRVMFAAMARVQPRSGVAYFHPTELATILADADGKPRPAATVRKAIAKAREQGLVLPDSTARRVWLNREHVQRGERASRVVPTGLPTSL